MRHFRRNILRVVVDPDRPTTICTEEICVHPEWKIAIEHLQLDPDGLVGIETARKKFGLRRGFNVHVRDHHPKESRKRARRISACTKKSCASPQWKTAVEFLQKHPSAEILPTQKLLGPHRAKSALRKHLKRYHPNEIEKRSLTYACVEDTCAHPSSSWKKAVKHLQKHPKAGIQPTAVTFKIHPGSLLDHLDGYHPKEVEKRSRKRFDQTLDITHPQLAKEWDNAKNDLAPSDVTAGSKKRVWWLCDQQHSWQARVGDRSGGKSCPQCYHAQRGRQDRQPNVRHFHRNRYNPIFRVEAPVEQQGCTEEICQHPMFYQSVQHLQLHPLAGIEPTATFFQLPGPSLYKHLTVFHPQEAKKRTLKRDCTEESCVDHKYQNAVKYLQENLKAEIVVTSRNFQLKPGSFRHHLEVYHPAEVIKRRRKSDCNGDVCINIEFRPAVDYLQQYSQAKIEPTERHFQLSRGRLRSHLAIYHPQEIRRRSPKRDCVGTICVDPKYHFAAEYKFEHPQDSIRSVAKKFSLIPGSLLHHLSRYHAQRDRRDRQPNVRHFHRNRHNPVLRVVADPDWPQQTTACTEEVCTHPIFQSAVNYLHQNPKASTNLAENVFRLKASSLYKHISAHHPQEKQKRQNKTRRTDEEEKAKKLAKQLILSCDERIMGDKGPGSAKIAKIIKEKLGIEISKTTINRWRIGREGRGGQKHQPSILFGEEGEPACGLSKAQKLAKQLILDCCDGSGALRESCDEQIMGRGSSQDSVKTPNAIRIAEIIQQKLGIELHPDTINMWRIGRAGGPSILFGEKGEPSCGLSSAQMRARELILGRDKRILGWAGPSPAKIANVIQQELGVELSYSTIHRWRTGRRGEPSILFGEEGEPPWPSGGPPIRRYNPIYRVEAPQQTTTCTEKICIHPMYNQAIEEMISFGLSIGGLEKKYNIGRGTLNSHIHDHHPQLRQKCTEKKCYHPKYRELVEKRLKGLSVKPGPGPSFGEVLRYHIKNHHSKKEECTKKKCVYSKYKVANTGRRTRKPPQRVLSETTPWKVTAELPRGRRKTIYLRARRSNRKTGKREEIRKTSGTTNMKDAARQAIQMEISLNTGRKLPQRVLSETTPWKVTAELPRGRRKTIYLRARRSNRKTGKREEFCKTSGTANMKDAARQAIQMEISLNMTGVELRT